MNLTAAQRKRLAREARKLAMECVTGTAPELAAGLWCGCAIGTMLKRARLYPSTVPAAVALAEDIDNLLHEGGEDDLGLVSNALIEADLRYLTRREAVVFPLLALADALEETP